jgi:hypothetical protein
MRHVGDCIVTVVIRVAALLFLVAFAAPASPASAQQAIYVVRHAERADQSADSPLSAEGVGRSYKLRDALKEASPRSSPPICGGRSRRLPRLRPRSI